MTEHECPVCGDRHRSEAALRDHTWDGHAACHHCGDGFDDRETLYTHWLVVHGDGLSRADRERAESAVGTPTFRDRLAHAGPVGAVAGASVSRRALVGGGATAGVAVVGGAVAGGFFGGNGGRSIASHPAASGLGAEPRLGPPPSEAEGAIVAFEDPSCPSCARFERATFPKLRDRLIETGSLSFVYRGIPVVRLWGEPAVLALEATYARDETAFWSLKDHYYRNQGRIGSGNVRAVTRRFLDERTDVDGAAVVSDVDRAAHRDAVDADLDASEDAGVRGTPTFFLFRSGSFVTDVVGPQSYDVFANALGL